MRRFALIPIVAMLVFSSVHPFAQAGDKGSSRKFTSVAIVPYNETPSSEIDKTIKKIEKNLKDQRGIRVLDRRTTNQILSYYLDHVDETTHDGQAAVFLREARQEYLQASYEVALQKLKMAEARIQSGMRKGASNALMPDLLIFKAKIAYVMGRKGEVAGIYDELLRLNPNLSFPKGLYSRWEHKALGAAKKKQTSTNTATFEISSYPKNSEIYVNGVHEGATYYNKPFVVNGMPPGKHCVELRTIHHETYVKCLVLASGETKSIDARLKRIAIPRGKNVAVVSPQRFKTAHELSVLVSGLGYYMGVDKVILVHGRTGADQDALAYQIGDSSLGAVNRPSALNYNSKKGESIALLTKEMRGQLQRDVLSNPGDQLISQSVGSIQLHEKRRKPIYKRPVFWALVGAGAAAGGIAAVLLGAGAAAATTGGIIIGL